MATSHAPTAPGLTTMSPLAAFRLLCQGLLVLGCLTATGVATVGPNVDLSKKMEIAASSRDGQLVRAASDGDLQAQWASYDGAPGFHRYLNFAPMYQHYLPLPSKVRKHGTKFKLLEIGVQSGGSAVAWKKYYGDTLYYVGFDINPNCKRSEIPTQDVYVETGSQLDPADLKRACANHGPFDAIIDDGGHTAEMMRTSIETLMMDPACLHPERGIYVIEDTHALMECLLKRRFSLCQKPEDISGIFGRVHQQMQQTFQPGAHGPVAMHRYNNMVFMALGKQRMLLPARAPGAAPWVLAAEHSQLIKYFFPLPRRLRSRSSGFKLLELGAQNSFPWRMLLGDSLEYVGSAEELPAQEQADGGAQTAVARRGLREWSSNPTLWTTPYVSGSYRQRLVGEAFKPDIYVSGSRMDKAFLQSVCEAHGPFDAIVDTSPLSAAMAENTISTMLMDVRCLNPKHGLFVMEGVDALEQAGQSVSHIFDELFHIMQSEPGEAGRGPVGIHEYKGLVILQRREPQPLQTVYRGSDWIPWASR